MELELLTTEMAAMELRLAPQTLSKYRCVGGGPVFYRVGRRCLYSRADLRAWLGERRRLSTSQSAPAGAATEPDSVSGRRKRGA